MSGASKDLRALSRDLGNAGRAIVPAASTAVGHVAGTLASEASDSSTQIVTILNEGSAHLGAVHTSGHYDETTGSGGLADVDLDGAADRLEADLLGDGVGLIMGGR